MTQKITNCLWFNFNAREAVNLYLEVFGNGRVLSTSLYGDVPFAPPETEMVIEFELFGQTFQALNGGPQFVFNEAISLVVSCEDQAEVDRYWSALTADGGEESQCGWLKDKFGVSWQIVPKQLAAILGDPDPAKAKRAVDAMLAMRKLDIAALERARDGG
jgi:predicted 3-demethylubiquinone-9 3-methyltransferase (glyoxalase superfamily)